MACPAFQNPCSGRVVAAAMTLVIGLFHARDVLAQEPAAPIDSKLAAADRPPKRKATPVNRDKPQYPTPIHAALAAGQPEKALEILNSRGTELSPVERHSLTGRAYFLLGRNDAARRELLSAVRTRPNHPEDPYWLGRALLACGSSASAAGYFQQAYRNGLETADLHHFWADALESAGQYLGAIEQRPWDEKDERIATPGTLVRNGVIVGPVLNRDDRVVVSPPLSALYQVYEALRLDPARGDSMALAARIWAKVGRHEQAVTCYARAAERLKGDALSVCRDGWAESLLALGEVDGYLKRIQANMDADGAIDSVKLARAHELAADAAGQRGDLAQQIRLLAEAVRLAPEPLREMALADSLMQANRVEEASTHLKSALDRCSNPTLRRQLQVRLRRATYLTTPR